jgi:hypothetical protein
METDHEATIVFGLLLFFWTIWFSLLCGMIVGIIIGVASVTIICFLDWREKDPELSIFDWGRRNGKLVYGVDVVAIQDEWGNVKWKFLR